MRIFTLAELTLGSGAPGRAAERRAKRAESQREQNGRTR